MKDENTKITIKELEDVMLQFVESFKNDSSIVKTIAQASCESVLGYFMADDEIGKIILSTARGCPNKEDRDKMTQYAKEFNKRFEEKLAARKTAVQA